MTPTEDTEEIDRNLLDVDSNLFTINGESLKKRCFFNGLKKMPLKLDASKTFLLIKAKTAALRATKPLSEWNGPLLAVSSSLAQN
ncbi:hypothetical protein [Vibrio coralliilyticus]|uniref:hypothetical protein n=1 Tax=Vibrio coralliilyticus TaxID=190893 RepID=UPI000C164919|nr:hypothetical protein [Vibrio coralliilyticus]